jgi:hypothetical protein
MNKLNQLLLIIGASLVMFISQSCNLLNPGCEILDCNAGTLNEETCACDCPEGYLGTTCESFDKTKVQALLDKGVKPKALFDGGIILDSLYGKKYAGGLIFFLNTEPANNPNFTGEGMVATETRYGDFDQYGCGGQLVGASGKEIGDGPTNTQKILDAMCTWEAKSAKICDALVIDTYDDWFLPSEEEMNLMYYNLFKKGHGTGWIDNIQRYQTSTEANENEFRIRFFFRDTVANVNKISGDDIRPARIF